MSKKERLILSADCETDPFKAGRIPAPFVWGVYDGVQDDYKQFDTTEAFMDYITATDCIIYAHNGGKFDWHFILDYMEPGQDIMIINGRLSKFTIGKAEFRDSYNILPVPLSAYKKDEIDYNIMEPEERIKPENFKEISSYLKSDCVYLWEMIDQFIARYGLNLTLAGAALKFFLNLYEIKAPESTQGFYDDYSKYYYGGRVECFEGGIIDENFKVIDINSAYPFAMINYHPFGTTTFDIDTLPDNDDDLSRTFITLECESAGAFPLRPEKGGLTFPNDRKRRTFHITGWEYIAARDTETLINAEIINIIEFSDKIKFDTYINHFYNEKKIAKENNDHANYIFSKLFLNTLYGKFSSNPQKYNEYTIAYKDEIESIESETDYKFDCELGQWALMNRPLPGKKQKYYNVAVAASITGFVRAYLWKAINGVKRPLYCDTDSIACIDTGTLKIDSTELGAWDIEADCDYGAIAGKKLYAFKTLKGDWKTASKGVRLTPEEIVNVSKGQTVTYTPIAPSFSVKRGIGFITRKINKSV